MRTSAFSWVLAVTLMACGKSAPPSAPSAGAPPPPEVTVALPTFQNISDSDEFTGRIEAVNSVQLRPRIGGHIESIHFAEGSLVQKGQLLFTLDDRPFAAELARLRAELASANAQLELARSNRNRANRLVGEGYVSKEESDRLSTLVKAGEATGVALLAGIRAAELNVAYTRVTAPISGRIGRIERTVGNLVSSNDVLTNLVSVDPVYVAFEADEQSYLKYQNLANAEAQVGLIDEQGTPHAAKMQFVDNQLGSSGTLKVRAVLPNPQHRFTPGLFARVKLLGGQSQRVALIDDKAVGTDLGKKFVLVVDAKNTAQYREVLLGPVFEGLRVVKSGLNEGERVVVNGLQRVRPGSPVQPKLAEVKPETKP
jgi:RND family efflux transporter MFP subunit